MKEQLITFETAKLAKEKKFNISCVNHYTKKGKFRFCHPKDIKYLYKQNVEGWIIAPTQSLLQKWLREVHNIHIELTSWLPTSWSAQLVYEDSPFLEEDNVYEAEDCKTYEEALEIGLQEALKLI